MKNRNKRINIIDISVIVVILLLIVGAFYKFGGLEKTNKNVQTIPITYTVEVKKIRPFVFDNVKVGDILYDKTSGNSIGKIVNIDSKVSREAMAKTNGDVELMEIENRVDVIFTVEAEATKSDSIYYVNRTYEIIKNSARKFMTKYFECSGTIRDISEI